MVQEDRAARPLAARLHRHAANVGGRFHPARGEDPLVRAHDACQVERGADHAAAETLAPGRGPRGLLPGKRVDLEMRPPGRGLARAQAVELAGNQFAEGVNDGLGGLPALRQRGPLRPRRPASRGSAQAWEPSDALDLLEQELRAHAVAHQMAPGKYQDRAAIPPFYKAEPRFFPKIGFRERHRRVANAVHQRLDIGDRLPPSPRRRRPAEPSSL